MKFVSALVSLLVAVVLLGCAQAKPTISTSISSNMLFQRNASNCIWGPSGNKTITVTLVNLGVDTQHSTFVFSNDTAADGSWEVWIPASVYTYYGYNNFSVQIGDASPGVTTFTNIIYGELWLCAGQSNMEFVVQNTFDGPQLLNNETRDPNLRLYKTPNVNNSVPLDYVNTGNWFLATQSPLGSFPAVCYAFGKEFVRQTGIPTGLIGTAWGGTYIEAWSSPDALAACPRFDKSVFPGVGHNGFSALYNGKLYPYRRFAVNGFLWYQGEQNGGRSQLYGCQLPALIDDMRRLFRGNPLAPFGFVQLTAMNYTSTAAEPGYYQMRYNMVNGTKNTRNVYYTTGIDLGDIYSQFGSIHSRNKTLLGQRLFNTIGQAHYGVKTSTPSFGPVPQSCCSTYNNVTNTTTYEVTFSGTSALVEIPTPYCTTCCSNSPFDVVGKNSLNGLVRVLVNNTRYSGNKAIFTLYQNAIPNGYNITQVRYAAYDYPNCAVYNPVNVGLLIAPQFNISCPATCPPAPVTTTTTTTATATTTTTGDASTGTSTTGQPPVDTTTTGGQDSGAAFVSSSVLVAVLALALALLQ